MKYVESSELSQLNAALCFSAPESQITGNIDLFTTKPATSDRRLIRALDKQLESRSAIEEEDAIDIADIQVLGTSLDATHTPSLISPPSSVDPRPRAHSATLHSNPFGPMHTGSSRKQYAYLISVLNASDPDRDFSGLAPSAFTREASPNQAANAINNLLLGLGSNPPPNMWDAIDRRIDLKDCKVFSLTLPQHFIQDESGVLWVRMWFFFNKRRKRVIFISLKSCWSYSPKIQPNATDDYDLTLDDEAVVGNIDLGE